MASKIEVAGATIIGIVLVIWVVVIMTCVKGWQEVQERGFKIVIEEIWDGEADQIEK